MLMFCFSEILFSYAQDTQIKCNTFKTKELEVKQCFKPGDPKFLSKKFYKLCKIWASGTLSKFTGNSHVFGLNWSMNSHLVKHMIGCRCWTSCRVTNPVMKVRCCIQTSRHGQSVKQQQAGAGLGWAGLWAGAIHSSTFAPCKSLLGSSKQAGLNITWHWLLNLLPF